MQAVDGQMGADYEIRTPVDAAVMEKEIRAAVHAVSPRMPIVHIQRLTDQIENSMIMERLIAELSIFFSAFLRWCSAASDYTASWPTPSFGGRRRSVSVSRLGQAGKP
jgi:hypothetical protein